jgi:predicted double-glycine peptidase
MRFVVKAYQEVCADLRMMLEELEESLEDIARAASLPEKQPQILKVVDKDYQQILDADSPLYKNE